MQLVKRLKLVLLPLSMIWLFTNTTQIQAQEQQQFQFDYTVDYTVDNEGATQVRQEITVTNLTTNYFAQNYKLSLTTDKIRAISVSDEQGAIPFEVNKSNGQTELDITFIRKTVGVDRQFTFVIAYEDLDIATKRGRIWEIIIPGLEVTHAINSYDIRLSAPKSFGEPAYFAPLPGSDQVWTLSEHRQNGITAAFGNEQNFAINLIYHIENNQDTSQIQEITLPPDTAYQKVIVSQIAPKPDNVVLDADGNWLARYSLPPRSRQKIEFQGIVLVRLNSDPDYQIVLSREQHELYTKSRKYWSISDPMQELAATLTTPRDIYDYVVNTLSYDYSRLEPSITRYGAEYAFSQPHTSVCMEFSDLFVALARARGIPARELHGYAYTTNSRLQPLSLLTDVLHAWVEYYDEDKHLWVPIDPTWGHTTRGIDYFSKLDFNHIVFAILGQKSDYPFPAGAFRLDDSPNKNVFVDFSDTDIELPQSNIDSKIIFAGSIVSGSKRSGYARIVNIGQVLATITDIEVESPLAHRLEFLHPVRIPPFGFVDIPIQVTTPLTLSSKHYPLTVTVNQDIEVATKLEILPLYHQRWVVVVSLILSTSFIIGIGAYIHAKTKA